MDCKYDYAMLKRFNERLLFSVFSQTNASTLSFIPKFLRQSLLRVRARFVRPLPSSDNRTQRNANP